MEGERKRPKGGFLHLFDWSGKSRKKLFLNNSELPGSKQAKENVENVANSQLDVIEVDDRRANSSNKGSSDFSCASSVTSDEGYGTRAAGVVARLMGLESLPTSNVNEPSSTSILDSHLHRASKYDRTTPNLWSDDNPMDYHNCPNKQEKYSWNSVELRQNKVQNWPIERFQTEILPPKSAKSIPITHHKLLSPIKGPGFIPTKNVDYVMEAAAKIIEASPRATTNGRVPSFGSSSVPLRIQDLKQKMEAAHTASWAQRSNKSCAANNMKGQRSDKSQSGSEGTTSCKASNNLRNKGKLVSLAIQEKVNVQRRYGSTSRSNGIMKQKEKNEVKPNQLLKSQLGTQKTLQKRTSERGINNVLRQNNHKQNCASNKDDSISKKSVSNHRKTQSMSDSVGLSGNVKNVVVKPETLSSKMGLAAMDSGKEKAKNISRKKQSVNSNLQIDRSLSHNVHKDTRSLKCNVTRDGCMNIATDNRKIGMDIVSFTFTSPIKKAMPNPQPSDQVMGKCNSSAIDSFGSNDLSYFESSTSYFPGLNVIGGDALGVLLEQKLRELANKMESSHCNVIREETCAGSTFSLKNSMPTLDMVSTTPAVQDKMSQIGLDKDKSEHLGDLNCFIVADSLLTVTQKWQQSEEMEEHSSSSHYSKTRKELECQHPVSILEPAFMGGSFSNTNGSKHCSPAQAQHSFNGISTNESLEVECQTEVSNLASSISMVDVVRKHIAGTLPSTEFKESSDWELDYVRDILDNAEIILKDFALGQTPNVISPYLFDQLENQENGTERNEEEYSKLGRKVLFDCISECLDFKCGQIFVGSCKAWAKLWTLFQRKGWLAEELYKEILGWKSMGDLMVDELVDKDMSSQYGKWLDFNIEAFEEGVEIEKGILTSLVDEVVSDLLLS